MAKLKGIISKMSGSIGNITLKSLNGETIVSEKPTSYTDARTLKQMTQRAKWLNIQAFAKLITSTVFRFAFEHKKDTQSDMNAFTSRACALPLEQTPWLCKHMRDAGLVIPAPYVISQGSIEEVKVEWNEASRGFKSSLNCMQQINSQTTVAQFAKSLVSNNSNVQYGDKLTIVMLKGRRDFEGNLRYNVKAVAIVLDATDETTLYALSSDLKTNDDDELCVSGFANGCAAIIITRNVGGKIHVSNSTLALGSEAQVFYEQYLGEARQMHAIDDLGGYKKQLLNPNTGSEVY